MKTLLKICGITSLDDACMAIDEGADMLGFNFFRESPRYIDPKTAAGIIEHLPSVAMCVGLLVRPTLADALEAVATSGVRFLQIYDPVDIPDYSALPVPVIHARRIGDGTPFSAQMHGAAMLLIDTHSKSALGGTGKTFDWDLIPASFPRERLALAGGITVDNIAEALERVNPGVIDVASGAESAPGRKDRMKMRRLSIAILKHNLNTLT
ncbi:MAG TPA: phosphoribosylanthranilate isomerase [Spirochaetota bacterium]|nr:phosphoribosylanthranilate isomerase [Spirochaetota bacterium]HPI23017.1 phosphoribosylanthranilate isomerase [Spirochaetota bacterium]HPU87997.1 phosphoribosylanthranilate isomerase [Spirochaetota bacterium]